jgi:CheY-like chemotaxis protein
MTAFASPENRAEAFRFGAADFLEKPLQAPALLVTIQRLLARPGDESGDD